MASNDMPPPDGAWYNQPTSCDVDPMSVTANFDTNDMLGDGTARRLKLPVVGLIGGSREEAYGVIDDSGSTTEQVKTVAHSTYLGHVILAVFALLLAFPFGVFALMLAGIPTSLYHIFIIGRTTSSISKIGQCILPLNRYQLALKR